MKSDPLTRGKKGRPQLDFTGGCGHRAYRRRLSIPLVTPGTLRDSFAMHQVIQTLMVHKGAKSTLCYTKVFALEVTRQLGVRSLMNSAETRSTLLPGGRL
jgi:hypothetical protein